MGDRANIVVKDGASKVYLYTHWSGFDLGDTLKEALERGEDRWNDGQYLTRIIFEEMIKEDLGSNTGYGISSVIGDGGEDYVVDVDNQTVNGKSFEEFVA